MSYQAKRNKSFQEILELIDENGKIIHSIPVILDADVVAKQLSEKYIALVQAQKNLAAIQTDVKSEEAGIAMETIGNGVVDLFQAVFGAEDTKTIIEFYESRYIEMCRQVIPFIVQVVIPKVREMAQESRNQVIQGYNRKQKRNVFKGK